MATKEEKIYYFARERHMASVVWNGKTNSALAEFSKHGVYATIDKGKAEKLLGMGYTQVDKKEILARNLVVPLPDELPSADYQPGAPGRGYTHAEGQAPPDVTGDPPKPFTEVQGSTPAALDSFTPPPGAKRTLR